MITDRKGTCSCCGKEFEYLHPIKMNIQPLDDDGEYHTPYLKTIYVCLHCYEDYNKTREKYG